MKRNHNDEDAWWWFQTFGTGAVHDVSYEGKEKPQRPFGFTKPTVKVEKVYRPRGER